MDKRKQQEMIAALLDRGVNFQMGFPDPTVDPEAAIQLAQKHGVLSAYAQNSGTWELRKDRYAPLVRVYVGDVCETLCKWVFEALPVRPVQTTVEEPKEPEPEFHLVEDTTPAELPPPPPTEVKPVVRKAPAKKPAARKPATKK